MRLLLDTHILIAIVEARTGQFDAKTQSALASMSSELTVSVVSLWEIAIKVRLGKLPLRSSLDQLPALLTEARLAILDVNAWHVLHEAEPSPRTRDPFDRLLLSQCAVESMLLVTVDRALASHTLAWKPD